MVTEANQSDVTVAKSSIPIIPDSITVFDRAYVDFSLFQAYKDKKAFFVTRAKENLRFEFLGQHEIPKKKGLQFDHTVQIKNPKHRLKYPGKLRLIGFFDHDSNKTFLFLTNNFTIAAFSVAQIYKERWHIELFFKWIKQNLKIKTFLGTSKNAVLSQIWIAMIYTLLLAYIKHQTAFSNSILSLSRIFQESIFKRAHLIDILALSKPPVSNNIRGSTQLSLC